MALRLGALYDALRDGNVPEDRARAAAEEVAGYENKIAGLDGKVAVLTWMVATNIMLTAGVLIRLLWLRP
jgi:hypothetical protein